MCRNLAGLTAIIVVVGLFSPLAVGQEDFRYDFDGRADEGKEQPADPTDWMTPENWSDGGFDPDEAFGPLLPSLTTRVEIEESQYGDNAPVIGPGDTAEAFGVRIGRFGGEGLLTMTGGTLDLADRCSLPPFTCNSRLRVGNADVIEPENRHPGTFNLSGGTVTTDTLWIGSGSHGEMNMSGGVVNTRGNFYLDWTSDLTFNTNSVLNMTGGTINIGTTFFTPGNLRLFRLSSLNLDGGQIFVDGSAELGTETALNPQFVQTPDVTVNITAGLLESKDFLQIGGSVFLNGGILRAASFNEALSAGTVEINGSGVLQLENSQESIAAVEGYISSGFFTTSEASPLSVDIVDIGGIDFTQVSIAALGLAGDYNENGFVDAADYTIWRDTLGSTTDLRANGDDTGASMGIIDQADYDFWKSSFGNTGAGSGSAVAAAAIPEPGSLVYGLIALVAIASTFRRA